MAAWTLPVSTTHPMDHTQVNSTIVIWTWTWLHRIYTVHWYPDCGSLLGPLYTIYRVLAYLRLLASSILKCSQNMSFLARLISDNSRSLEKLELGGHCPPPPPPRENFCTGSEFLFRFVLHSSINFRDINGFSKLGPRTLIRSQPRGSKLQSRTIEFYEYDFLLVTNCTQGRILHHFRDTAFNICNIAIFGYPLCFTLDRGVTLGQSP